MFNNRTKIHPEGYVFIGIFAFISIFLYKFSFFLGVTGIFLTLWCCYFFRDPQRQSPIGDDLIVAPADGIISSISKAVPPQELGIKEEMTKISIFLSVFDVHVNRVPASGQIKALHYNPGKFINASFDKASIDNERQSILMEMTDKTKLVFVQIAGLIARRIVCELEEDQNVEIGDRFGIIRFGSRVDLYIPSNFEINISKGQRCVGGETLIANISNKDKFVKKFKAK